MTAHKVVVIECNRCGRTVLPGTMILEELIHLATPAPDGVVDARRAARVKGWIHAANGKDLCSECRETAPAPPKRALLDHIPHPHWGGK